MTKAPPHTTPFVLRWTVIVATGEALGFAIAAVIAVAVTVAGLPDPARYAAIVAAGAAEGALLGTAQFAAMRAQRPSRAAWIAATSGAAAFAWAIGMLPSTFPMSPGPAGMVVLGTIGVLVILASIPFAQWAVLHRARTVRWIPVNMGAWTVAILWTFAPSPLVDETTPVGSLVLLYTVAGLLMATTIALLTARTARSLFGGPDSRTTADPAPSLSAS